MSKQRKVKVNPNSILVPIRSKMNKSGAAYIENSNNHITQIVSRYDNGMVQTKSGDVFECCLLYTSPSPRDRTRSRMPSSA